MKMVKILEQKAVIQIFGVGLILAPFLNILFNMSQTPADSSTRWSLALFIKFFMAGVTFQKILNVASVLVGFALLRGSKHAWRYVLFLLGGYIFMQMTYLGQNFRSQPMSIVFFLINIGLFLFIADQLVWKQKIPVVKPAMKPIEKLTAKPVAKLLTTAAPVKAISSKKIMIQLYGFGIWAQLSSLSTKGIEVKCIGTVPDNISQREIDLTLPTGIQMRARLTRQKGDYFYFEYLSMPETEKIRLADWIKSKAS